MGGFDNGQGRGIMKPVLPVEQKPSQSGFSAGGVGSAKADQRGAGLGKLRGGGNVGFAAGSEKCLGGLEFSGRWAGFDEGLVGGGAQAVLLCMQHEKALLAAEVFRVEAGLQDDLRVAFGYIRRQRRKQGKGVDPFCLGGQPELFHGGFEDGEEAVSWLGKDEEAPYCVPPDKPSGILDGASARNRMDGLAEGKAGFPVFG